MEAFDIVVFTTLYVTISRLFLERKKIMSDMNVYYERVFAKAVDVFDDEVVARDWIMTVNDRLGCAPYSLLNDEDGVCRVEKVLVRIAHGVYE